MGIVPFGRDFDDDDDIFSSIDEKEFAAKIADNKFGQADEDGKSATKGDEIGIPPGGWTYFISDTQSNRAELENILEPLKEHRGLLDLPIYYDSSKEHEDWDVWISENYHQYQGGDMNPPRHVLLVGDPEKIPYAFQNRMSHYAIVGRVDLPPDDLKIYVKKIIDFEKNQHTVTREAKIFATDHGIKNNKWDATHYSHHKMAIPMRDKIKGKNFTVDELFADDATRPKLESLLKSTPAPAIVYTATHGTAPGKGSQLTLEEQKRQTGSIVCQDKKPRDESGLFMAKDVADLPQNEPFLKGTIFFQFSCFGYGTPKESDFNDWLPDGYRRNSQIADSSFVAQLPQKLLSHPNGPIAYVGHVDIALWQDGPKEKFTPDPDWNILTPFWAGVRQILEGKTIGDALIPLNQKYMGKNDEVVTYCKKLRNGENANDEYKEKLANAYLEATDAKNFLIFGDPAVKLNVGEV